METIHVFLAFVFLLVDGKSMHIGRLKGEPVEDHIVGMKMERDGDVNKNYHHEVFLGREVTKIGDTRTALTKIFKNVDSNSDSLIDEAEMTDWVLTKTREHFLEARSNNKLAIEKLDVDKDNSISWNEFLSNLIAKNAHEREEVLKQLNNNEEVHIPAEFEEKVQQVHESWIRVRFFNSRHRLRVLTNASYLQVQDIGKKSLTYEQFFDFRHPETSSDTLQFLVEDILHDMDMDDSNDLTVQEYVAMPPGVDVDSMKDEWTVERRKEFRNVIDLNKDGRVVVDELKAYLDPLSHTMAGQEARQLIGFGDSDEDGRLTLQEILENSEFYTGSKLYNYAQSVHEEF